MTKAFDRKMLAMGYTLCDHCGFWCNDAVPCAGVTVDREANAMTIDHSNLCGDCQEILKTYTKEGP